MSSSDRTVERHPAREPDRPRDESTRDGRADAAPADASDDRSAHAPALVSGAAPGAERRRARRKPFVLRSAHVTPSPIDAAATPPLRRLVRLLQNLGPYLAIEILLPGGTLLAFLLYASRNGRPFREDAPVLATLAALTTAGARALARWMPMDLLRFGGSEPAERDGLEPLGLAPS
jgi:hypothetical protein